MEDVASRRSLSRVGLAYAMHLLDQRQAAGIVVSHLDRLSRSVLDFASMLTRAEAGGWNVVVLDLGLDLTTPHGEFVAHTLAAAAQLERRMIGLRTRRAWQGSGQRRPTRTPPCHARQRPETGSERAGGWFHPPVDRRPSQRRRGPHGPGSGGVEPRDGRGSARTPGHRSSHLMDASAGRELG